MQPGHPHLDILRCPRTGLSLRAATPAETESARRAHGQSVGDFDAAVVSTDGRFVYPVQDGTYILLSTAAVALTAPVGAGTDRNKVSVQRFYDDVGWTEGVGGFVDAEINEDLRAVSEEYRTACNMRIHDRLPPAGRYLLDAASGPVQYADYLTFSEHYETRICVDVSRRALSLAQQRLGDHGLYVLGDVTCLPLQDGVADAFVSLHTIYHVPVEQQASAFRELHRVLSPTGRGVVVYSWPHTPLTRLLNAPLRFAQAVRSPAWAVAKMRARLGHPPTTEAGLADGGADLYFAPHNQTWFSQQRWPFRYEIECWRSLPVPALRAYVPDSAIGRRFLRRLARLEQAHPRLAGRFGQYPLITVFGGPA